MGYKVPKRTLVLEFEQGDEHHGLEVRMILEAPLSLLFEMQRLARIATEEEAERILRTFGDALLIDWNVEDDEGQPIPATGDGLLSLPFSLARLMIAKWTEAATGPPAPLGAPSPNGNTLAAMSMALGT